MGDSDQVGVHCWGGKGNGESQGSKENNRTVVLGKSGDHGVGPVFILMEGVGGATNLHNNCGGGRCLEQINLR